MARRFPSESVFHSVYNSHLYDTEKARSNIVGSTKNSLDYVQRLGLLSRHPIHSGCVNTVHWNRTGEYFLSGSDDQYVVVTNPHSNKVLVKYKTAHHANIFSARFLPQSNDQSFVSCSGDGIVLHTEFLAPYIRRKSIDINGSDDIPTYERFARDVNLSYFSCHKSGTTYDVLTMPMEPRCFMSCGDDGTVRLFDLRVISSCHKTSCKDNVLVMCSSAVNAMDLSPISQNYLAVGSSDAVVRIYDRRYLTVNDFSYNSCKKAQENTRPVKAFPIPLPTKRQYRMTCVRFSPEETELLVSYSSEYLYLFDFKNEGVNIKELNARTRSIKAAAKANTPSQSPSMTAEQVTRRLRLRGDWSDTGPDARPERVGVRVEVGQVRPQLQTNIMSRMTDVITRLLNDPRTHVGLTGLAQELNRETHNSLLASVSRATGHNFGDMARPSTSSAWRNAASRTLSRQERRQRWIPDREAAAEFNIEESTTRNNTRTLTTDDPEKDAESLINTDLADLDMEAKREAAEAADDDINLSYLRMKFEGHRNARTIIKQAAFWGTNYIMSGSDCGHIFTWDRRTGKLVMLMQADQHVVNCLQPHPELPYLASSGIDYDVKIWAPVLQKNGFKEAEAEDLMKRNAIMLEQTKDTITVPAAFMIRMLACIHSLRNRESRSSTNQNRSSNSSGSSSNSSNNDNDNGNMSNTNGNSNISRSNSN